MTKTVSDSTKVVSRRREVVRVKTAKKRSVSSANWLRRQLNDPYVAAAKVEGYRSRAAYKLIQLEEKFHFLKSGQNIVDLGAAPGGWSQIAAAKNGKAGKVIGIDLLPIEELDGCTFIHLDFMADEAPDRLKKLLRGKAHVVLSDLAPSTTGHTATDHIRILTLVEAAALFAREVLMPGGVFVCKLFQGGAEKTLLDMLKKDFSKVRHAKPDASRADSAETYLVAEGFRG